MSEPEKPFVGRSAPYQLGQFARTYGYAAKVNPYVQMGDEMLREAAPNLTWEEAADQFERGWHFESEIAEKQPKPEVSGY